MAVNVKYHIIKEIAKVPATTGDLDICFGLVESVENGKKSIGIVKKDKVKASIISAMYIGLDEVDTLAEIFGNLAKAMKENK